MRGEEGIGYNMRHMLKLPKTESKTVEFKNAFNQDVIESLVAFANADGGARAAFEDHGVWFKVVLMKIGNASLGKLGGNREKILEAIRADARITTLELAKRLGISQAAVENNIGWLRQHGLLRRVGPAKGGHWEVVG